MEIDPVKVRAIAGEVGDALARLRAFQPETLAPAEGHGAGWLAAVAARSMWEPFVLHVRDAIGEFDSALVGAVDAYVASDQQGADSLRCLR